MQRRTAMAALFPRWSNRVARGVIAAVVLLVLGLPVALMAWVRTPYNLGQGYPIEQPVQFDHRHHVADDGIDCRYCHSAVERSSTAGIPSTSLCMNCHGQIWNTSPLLAPVRASYETGRPIAWNRVHQLPDFVYFDHAIHVGKGIGCVSCHGRVDLMPRVFQVAPLTMGWCLDCHRAPERHLRPLDQITNMAWTPDRPQLEVGRELKARYGVREMTTCTTCHR
ncbi:MAG TPA: cytochrome c3 family protein [Thermodesulfobacteriota bacterium]